MGALGHRWAIVGLGGLSCGVGAFSWMMAPTSSIHDTAVSAAPQIRVMPRATPLRSPWLSVASSQPIALAAARLNPSDRKIFNQLRRRANAENWTSLPIGTLTQRIGESFLGSE